MGKIILEFDSEEEKDDARMALDGYKWRGAVWDLDQKLREATKYGYIGKIEATAEQIDTADKFRTILREILEEYNLNLD